MKIALMYSGLPRHILDLHANHRQYIGTESDTVDVYFHFWDIWGYTNRGWMNTISHRNSELLTDENKHEICSLLKPKRYAFESFETAEADLLDVITACESKPQTLTANARSYVFQFYSIYKTFSLIEEPYDVVVRLRADIEFAPVNPYVQQFHADGAVHTYHDYRSGGTNDQMAYATPAAMKVYSDTFANLRTLHTSHPESLLQEQLTTHGVPVFPDWDIHYTIKRIP